MANNNINNDFDALTAAKAKGSTNAKLILLLACACIAASFAFAFFVFREAYSKIAVVDTGGQYLQTTVEDSRKLQKALILQTCANLNYYINSFDMNGYMDNYNRARSYCSTDELNKITEFFKGEKMYFDAIERGVVFRSEINEIHEVSLRDDNSIFVKFNSIMTKTDGADNTIFLIESEGVLNKITPQYPDNTTGYFFSQYTQVLKKYLAKKQRQDE